MKLNTRGIQLSLFWTAILSFLPLLIGSEHQKVQWVLFWGYVPAWYLVLLALGNISRWMLWSVAGFVLFFSLSHTAFYIQAGGPLSYNILASIMDTNIDEALGFLKSTFAYKFVLFFGLIVFLFISLIRITRNVVWFRNELSHKRILIGSLMLAVFSAVFVVKSQFSHSRFFPGRELLELHDYYTEVYGRVKAYRGLEYEYDGPMARQEKVTTLLVIGESLTRHKMGVYNPEFPTTPKLQQFRTAHPDNLILYDNAIASSSYSRVSVPSMLSLSPAVDFHEITKHPSIIKIAVSAGTPVSVISNQKKSGIHDSFISAYFDDATQKKYLSYGGDLLDEKLLPDLTVELEDPIAKQKLVVLHMTGSHWPYNKTYPHDMAYFQSDEILHHYLNSVYYNDYVLSLMLGQVMSADYPVIMIYLSDHGEYLNDFGDGHFGHGFRKLLTIYEADIPFLVIGNDRFLAEYPEEFERMRSRVSKTISLDNLSHTILGLNGFYDSSYLAEYDLSSTEFREMPRYIVDRNNNIFSFEDIPIESPINRNN